MTVLIVPYADAPGSVTPAVRAHALMVQSDLLWHTVIDETFADAGYPIRVIYAYVDTTVVVRGRAAPMRLIDIHTVMSTHEADKARLWIHWSLAQKVHFILHHC
jgi:hypothetical protein